jgi:hypothetical protein
MPIQSQAVCRKKVREDFSRKGARAQSAAAFLKRFSLRLCAFAREIVSVTGVIKTF